MVINIYHLTRKDSKEKRRWSILKWSFLGMLLLFVGVAIAVLVYEVRTSSFQAQEFSRYATTLTYTLEAGPSDQIVYPKYGPFDKRLGYVHMPRLLEQVQSRGMEIERQTRFSPELINYTSHGYFTPYREKMQAGLKITDARGDSVYQFRYPKRVYPNFESIPPLITQSLLFIENRELLDTAKHNMNPAIDWARFTRAIMHEAAKSVGLEYRTIGGSTLSTQIEKFRHSPGGRTTGANEKIRQMVSSSIRTYQQGPETYPARRDIVLSYVNSVPLSAAPGFGEVHGLADGLWVWFGRDYREVSELLNDRDATGEKLVAQGQVLREVLSLMIAQRRPSFYLAKEGRPELNSLTGSYLRLLANNGYISPELRDAGLAQDVPFRDFKEDPVVEPQETNKGTLMVRTHLSAMLGKSLYDLDRMDLSATTTLQRELQEQVSMYLKKLNDPEFARTVGVVGERMLSPNRTEEVQYSFTLFERSPHGNLVRVQTDNTDQPFDMNEGSKLELGSTAKLRVLVTYLEVIAEIHSRYADQPVAALRSALNEPQDHLTRWVLRYLMSARDKSLQATLHAALERRYSASPREAFFTGGGVHYFHNFQNKDNGRRPTVREAFLKSINLPFVRLMRDIVSYTTYQQVDNPTKLIRDGSDPRRRAYLTRFANKEAQVYLWRFWRKYNGKSPDERFELLVKGLRQDPVRLGAVHRYLYPEKDLATFDTFLRTRLPKEKLTNDRVVELYERYGPEAYNLPDQGYIARTHPLELWLLGYMLKHPEAQWYDVVDDSKEERQEVYKWLFRTRFKNARDSRIRTLLEQDAFVTIQQRWQKLGYPFKELVPSLATALGSSGDRPEALAELMGIIINNGVRQRTLRIEDLQFATQTPYETALKWQTNKGEQVMVPEVASIVEEALLEVVEVGTARRLRGGFTKANGKIYRMGGKTGTGDNQLVTLSARGHRIASRAINRTATFVFVLGDRHFGTLTAFVPGRESADFHFTSSLPVQVLKGMAPILEPYLDPDASTPDGTLPGIPQPAEQKIAAEGEAETPTAVSAPDKPTPVTAVLHQQ
ncbi:MAG: transglycosylase domain-containing protein [Hymenobacteraceae bacterium]|nr:transglycosylase domain-containing protein [Hymenobacteraceae bacterium]